MGVVLAGAAWSWAAPPTAASPITVQVVAADAAKQTLTVSGTDEFDNKLPAPDKTGNQTVAVGAGDAGIGYVGHQVTGDLSQNADGWRLDAIFPADPAPAALVTEATRRLHENVVAEGRRSFVDVGDEIPDFALYDQSGHVVQAASLRGRRLVLNFIFTSCAQPTMCPASTQRMGQLQRALQDAKIDDVTLVTITFDPEHDTPGVLRQYGQAYGLDFNNYLLLTGPAPEIDDLMTEFGILRQTVDGILQHTMATILVTPEGRIVFRRESNLWTAGDFVERIKDEEAAAKSAPKPAAG